MRVGSAACTGHGFEDCSQGDKEAPCSNHRKIYLLGAQIVLARCGFRRIRRAGESLREGGARSWRRSHYFAVAASFFTHVSLVAIVGNDFTAEDERIFRGRPIDTDGLERAEGRTFFWAGAIPRT